MSKIVMNSCSRDLDTLKLLSLNFLVLSLVRTKREGIESNTDSTLAALKYVAS